MIKYRTFQFERTALNEWLLIKESGKAFYTPDGDKISFELLPQSWTETDVENHINKTYFGEVKR